MTNDGMVSVERERCTFVIREFVIRHLASEYPRKDSNPVCDVRSVACILHTPRAYCVQASRLHMPFSIPPPSRTASDCLEDSRASITLAGYGVAGGTRTRCYLVHSQVPRRLRIGHSGGHAIRTRTPCGALFSKQARPALSGYPPNKWSVAELNRHILLAGQM